MSTQRLRPVLVNDLLETLFAGDARGLRDDCAAWCAASPRFAAFLDMYRDKIRKKLRSVTDGEGLRDLRAELLTAACLLSEPAFTLEYEKYAASKTRGPDFTVLFKGHTPFNVEVKRIRGQAQPGKWADVLCDKLRQLPTGMSNALVIYRAAPIDRQQGEPFDAGAAMAVLRAAAERKDDALFMRRRLQGARDYLRQLPKLSALVVRADGTSGASSFPASWLNPQARHPLAAELRNALLRCMETL